MDGTQANIITLKVQVIGTECCSRRMTFQNQNVLTVDMVNLTCTKTFTCFQTRKVMGTLVSPFDYFIRNNMFHRVTSIYEYSHPVISTISTFNKISIHLPLIKYHS